ncbi:MAG: hypothetical protein IPM29_07320 [Planctomycetes bacterium]|nr:hypothetical protein [Planctomycetota bacterium]
MKILLARSSAALLAALALTAALPAQRDRIELMDGTVIDRVQVRSFDLRNVEFRRNGRDEQQSTDTVAELRVERVLDAYKQAFADASGSRAATFVSTAERLTDPFLQQFGYYEAARSMRRNGDMAGAFQALSELEQKLPNSGFVPELYRFKLDYYLSKGTEGARDAMKVAKDYETATLTRGYPTGFQNEAKYYLLRAEALAGQTTPSKYITAMQTLADSSRGTPWIAARARLAVADTQRSQSQVADARAGYERLLAAESTSEGVRAGAWLGLGHCYFLEGSASNKDPFREALLAFLRVYVETPDADAATVAESLHMGAQAAEKWGGPEATRMARTLRYRLERDYPGFSFR